MSNHVFKSITLHGLIVNKLQGGEHIMNNIPNSYALLSFFMLISIALFNLGGCSENNSDKNDLIIDWGDFNCCSGPGNISLSNQMKNVCFSFEEIELSECPAADALETCEPYFCEGCTSEFCFDFLFPDSFAGCEAIDCHTIDCDGVYGIQVDSHPSWTTLINNEEVQIICHSQY